MPIGEYHVEYDTTALNPQAASYESELGNVIDSVLTIDKTLTEALAHLHSRLTPVLREASLLAVPTETSLGVDREQRGQFVMMLRDVEHSIIQKIAEIEELQRLLDV